MSRDVIIAIDGEPVTNLAKVKRMFREDGKEYLLTTKRGDETMQMKIKL